MATQSFLKAVALTLAVPTVALFAQRAIAAAQDFRFYNETGSTVVGLYLAPVNSAGTVPNSLRHAVSSGNSTTIVFPESNPHCLYDILTRFNDGSHVEEHNVNLCRVSQYTVY